MSMPETRAGAVSRDAIRGLASSWWLFLILGILWILFGMFVLSYNVGSLLALAVFAGVTFVMTGITQVLAASRVDSWRWLYLIGGALSIIAGILAFIWPGSTLLVLSVILAWFLVLKGIVDTVGALASIGRPWWWVGAAARDRRVPARHLGRRLPGPVAVRVRQPGWHLRRLLRLHRAVRRLRPAGAGPAPRPGDRATGQVTTAARAGEAYR
jgi:uncharacterized membrane protein HdeD (DUF308 family)